MFANTFHSSVGIWATHDNREQILFNPSTVKKQNWCHRAKYQKLRAIIWLTINSLHDKCHCIFSLILWTEKRMHSHINNIEFSSIKVRLIIQRIMSKCMLIAGDDQCHRYHNTIRSQSEVLIGSDCIAGIVGIHSCETHQYKADLRIICQRDAMWDSTFQAVRIVWCHQRTFVYCSCRQLPIWTTQSSRSKLPQNQAHGTPPSEQKLLIWAHSKMWSGPCVMQQVGFRQVISTSHEISAKTAS